MVKILKMVQNQNKSCITGQADARHNSRTSTACSTPSLAWRVAVRLRLRVAVTVRVRVRVRVTFRGLEFRAEGGGLAGSRSALRQEVTMTNAAGVSHRRQHHFHTRRTSQLPHGAGRDSTV